MYIHTHIYTLYTHTLYTCIYTHIIYIYIYIHIYTCYIHTHIYMYITDLNARSAAILLTLLPSLLSLALVYLSY